MSEWEEREVRVRLPCSRLALALYLSQWLCLSVAVCLYLGCTLMSQAAFKNPDAHTKDELNQNF